MFFLVLRIAGEIALITGPMSRAECEARLVVMDVDHPPAHHFSCQTGRIDVEMEKR